MAADACTRALLASVFACACALVRARSYSCAMPCARAGCADRNSSLPGRERTRERVLAGGAALRSGTRPARPVSRAVRPPPIATRAPAAACLGPRRTPAAAAPAAAPRPRRPTIASSPAIASPHALCGAAEPTMVYPIDRAPWRTQPRVGENLTTNLVSIHRHRLAGACTVGERASVQPATAGDFTHNSSGSSNDASIEAQQQQQQAPPGR